VSRNNPVAAGAITWNRRLSIALDFHPALKLAPGKGRLLLDEWKKLIADGAFRDAQLAAA
jgi:hypothetical protein